MSRRWSLRRSLILVFLLAGAAVAAVPYVCSREPLRDMLFATVLPRLQGTLRAGGIDLGWFSPVACRDLEIFDKEGVRAIAVPRFEGDRPLWRMVAWPGSVGSFRAEGAHIEVVVNKRQVNLAQLVDPTAKWRMVGLGLEVVDGVFSYRTSTTPQAWELAPINLKLQILPARPTEGRAAEVLVKAGRLLDRATLTPQMTAELLKYVLPVMADAPAVSGQFSLEVDPWQVPLERPTAATGSGRLVLHRVDVAPGALAAALAEVLRLPPGLRIAEESVVPFRLVDGRFHHQDLQFSLPGLKVCTRGSVGLDQSLDLTAEMGFEGKLLGSQAGQAKRTLAIRVGGTLSRPKIDFPSVGQNAPLLLETLQAFLQAHKAATPTNGEEAEVSDRRGKALSSPTLRERWLQWRSDSKLN